MGLNNQQKLKIRTYHSTGACKEEIAEKVGISVQDVASELERVGFRPHIKDEPQPHAFAKVGINNPPANPSKPLLKWTDEKVAQLRHLYVDENKTVAEIAEIMGLTSKQISQGVYLRKNKWDKPKEDKPKNVVETPKSVSKVPQSVIKLVKEKLEMLRIEFVSVSEEYHKMRADIEEFEGFIEREGYNVQCK